MAMCKSLQFERSCQNEVYRKYQLLVSFSDQIWNVERNQTNLQVLQGHRYLKRNRKTKQILKECLEDWTALQGNGLGRYIWTQENPFFVVELLYHQTSSLLQLTVSVNNLIYIFYQCLHQWFLTRNFQKQPLRGVPRKRCSENMQQIYFVTLLKSHFGIDVLL